MQEAGGLGLAAKSSSSLVKYGPPLLIDKTVTTGRTNASRGTGGLGKEKRGGQSSSTPLQQQQVTEDILRSILPPREWTHEGQLWVQFVSPTPATRADVLKLQEDLNRSLQQRKARETGICPIREELYSQCFDEIIRQVTIVCSERGLLLLRVRDEVMMILGASQTLYESSLAFGMRKALQGEQLKAACSTQRDTLLKEIAQVEADVVDLQELIERRLKQFEEESKRAENEHLEATSEQRQRNAALKARLEEVISASHK